MCPMCATPKAFLHAASCSGRFLWVMMELCLEFTLTACISDGIAEAEASRWVAQLALALQHMYDMRLIHRDIKPGQWSRASRAVMGMKDVTQFSLV